MKRTLTPGRPKRWIVVDDNAALGEVIYLCLGQLGLASVEWYASGADAIEALAWDRSEIELLVTDCDMPGLNGLELARRLRADLPSLKVILVTGESRGPDRCVHGRRRSTGDSAEAIFHPPTGEDRAQCGVRANS
jgi:CheY-like chemotaxis protein